jgi:hypothetical protein
MKGPVDISAHRRAVHTSAKKLSIEDHFLIDNDSSCANIAPARLVTTGCGPERFELKSSFHAYVWDLARGTDERVSLSVMVGTRKGSRRRSPRVSAGRVRKDFVTH